MLQDIFKVVLAVAAFAPSLIKEAEDAFSGTPGSGPQKKQFVIDVVQSLLSAMVSTGHWTLTATQQQVVMAVVTATIDTIVAGFNAAAAFKKAAPAVAAPAVAAKP